MKRDPSRSFKFVGFLAKCCTTRVRTRPTDFNKLSIFMLLFEFFPIPGFHCWFRRDGSMDLKNLLLEKRSKLVFYFFGVCSRLSSTIACAPQTDPAAIPWFGNFPQSPTNRDGRILKQVRHVMHWVLLLPLLWVRRKLKRCARIKTGARPFVEFWSCHSCECDTDARTYSYYYRYYVGRNSVLYFVK